MCFNKEVSLLMALFGTLVASKLMSQDKITIGVLLLLLSAMQLLEFFLWIYRKKGNLIVSRLIPIVIIIQVIGCYACSMLLQDLSEAEQIISGICMGLVIILLLYSLYRNFNKKTTVNKGCKLSWNILEFKYKLTGILLTVFYLTTVLITGYHSYKGNEFVAIVLSTIVFAIGYSIYMGDGFKVKNIGSFWCFLALALSCFYMIIE